MPTKSGELDEMPPFDALAAGLSSFGDCVARSYAEKNDEAVLEELLQECQMKIISLKMLTRRVLFMMEEKKLQVIEKKKLADAAHLRLQNLLYEKNLLMSEIKACDNFKTPEFDKIDLVTKEVFGKEAPKELRAAKESVNPNEFLMNRLAYELMERKKLTEKYDEMMEQVKGDEDALHSKIKENEDLRIRFKEVIKTTLVFKQGIEDTPGKP